MTDRIYFDKFKLIVLFSVFVLLCTGNFLNAQQPNLNNSSYIPGINIKSPDVSEIVKYIEYPVDVSTGIPQNNVPLYTINTQKLTVPISLSYHAGGIKVDQRASVVGLGWTLNAGGVISQIVKDKSDIGMFSNHNEYGFIPDLGQNVLDSMLFSAPFGQYYHVVNNNGVSDSLGIIVNDRLRNYDNEPDIYYIFAPELNGIISLDNSKKFVSYGLDTLIVIKGPRRYEDNTQLILKSKFGTIYTFGKAISGNNIYIDTTISSTSSNLIPRQTDSYNWYLSSIISKDLSDTIRFEYLRMHDEDGLVTNVVQSQNSNLIYPGNTVVDFHNKDFTYVSKTVNGECFISKIIFKDGHVDFNYISDRLDVYHKLRLSEVAVYNNDATLIQKIKLHNNSYFNRNGCCSLDLAGIYGAQNIDLKSLKLDGLQIFREPSQTPLQYYFYYDTLNALPRVHSGSQDMWGYYNGKSGGVSQTFFVDNYNRPVIVGEDRTPDPNYMKAGVLNRIVYPTGGYTTYEYEPNQYLSTQTPLQGNLITTTKSLSTQAMSSNNCSGVFAQWPSQTILRDTIKNLPQNPYYANYSITFSGYNVIGNGPMYCTVDGTLYQYYPNASSKTITGQLTVYNGSVVTFELNTNGATGGGQGTPAQCPYPYINVTLSYDYLTTQSNPTDHPLLAGGLRVKRISSIANSSNEPSYEKLYEYDNPQQANGTGVGILLTDPYSTNVYFSDYLGTRATNNYEDIITSAINILSNSTLELGENNGASVFYPKVTEYNNSNGTPKDKTEYYFMAIKPYRDNKPATYYRYDAFYYPSWLSTPRNTEKILFSYSNGNFDTISKTSNYYTLNYKYPIRALKILTIGPEWTIYNHYPQGQGTGGYFGANYNRYWAYLQYIPRGGYQLSATATSTYDNDSLKLTESVSYDYNKANDLISKKYVNSSGKNINTYIHYTGDLSLNVLSKKGILSTPVSIENTVNNQLVSGSFYSFDTLSNIVKSYDFERTLVRDVSTNIQYNVPPDNYKPVYQLLYGLNNNLNEKQKYNDNREVYLWGYKSQYPVAKIIGSDYATVSAVVTQAQIDAAVASDQNLRTLMNTLRTDSRTRNALVSSYTYKPLVGMTSETDPSGRTTYYEYDGFGRLSVVKDDTGKVLKKYCYNYAGQPVNCNQ
ncbi:hypothetical protein A8C56_02710 [Niabella ginsenosidivorans]|uniref:YD repeat-containing protein n=2 Tax=Niabella ginsenosidivorans TaxID=1176587 RepID=A0A1A9HY79_9BACT|nr:hypothetical protein A8C56_02710 [Niabella ginsenosidivorans]